MPNFLIIGAPRSATTFLARCLAEHPQVYVAWPRESGSGDIHFFDVDTQVSYERRYDKGLGWYARLFDGVGGETAIGEKTATYLCDAAAPELIHRHLPQVRLITVLRNPIERAYSHYRHVIGQIPPGMGFLEACFSEHTKKLLLLEAGLYQQQILRYRAYFAPSAFLFLIYEELQADPLGALQRVFQFLGVETGFIPMQHNQRINAGLAEEKLTYRLRAVGGAVKRRFPRLFWLARRTPLMHWIESRTDRAMRVESPAPLYPSLPAEVRQELAAVYYEHNCRLSDLLGRDLVGLWHGQDHVGPG